MPPTEKWRPVVEYEGLYEVSNLGRVRSLDRIADHPITGPRRHRGRVLRQNGVNNQVTLFKDGVARAVLVQRVVAAAWLGPCPPGQKVRHRFGYDDNSIFNLMYGSCSEIQLTNCRHPLAGSCVSERCRSVRRSDGVEFVSIAVAAEASNCKPWNIWATCAGKQKTTNGYGWEYI